MAVALVPTYLNRGNELVPLALVGALLALYIYFHPGVRRAAEQGEAELATAGPEGEVPAVGASIADDVIDLEARRRAGGDRP